MKAFTGATRTAFLVFFASHIPITLMIDCQALLPEALYPQTLRNLLDLYANFVQDPLMTRPTFAGPWFQSFVIGELLFQLPFFITAVRMMRCEKQTWPDWFRTACLIYGAHTATTLIPILAIIIFNPESTVLHKFMALSVYLPYLLFPLWLTLLAAMDNTKTTTVATTNKSKAS